MTVIRLKDLKDPLFAFSADVNRAEQEMFADDDYYSRRNHIRTVFAMVEGTIHIFRHTVLEAASEGTGQLSSKELSHLRNGRPPKELKYPRTAASLLFMKKILKKAFGYSLEFNITPDSWEEFIRAIEIRNRIVHPNGLQDFEVSKEESELVRRVSHWFDACVLDWFKQFIATHPVVEDDKEVNLVRDGDEYAM